MGRCLVFSEDEFKENFHVLNVHGIGTGSNPFQSMPISTNPVPIPGQSETTLSPRNLGTSAPCRLIISLLGDEIHATQSALNANLTQSNVNFPFLQKIPICPSLPILANPGPFLSIAYVHKSPTGNPIWSNFCQFKPIQYQSEANLMPVQGQLFHLK